MKQGVQGGEIPYSGLHLCVLVDMDEQTDRVRVCLIQVFGWRWFSNIKIHHKNPHLILGAGGIN